MNMFSRIDKYLIFAVLVLAFAGMLSLYSSAPNLLIKQIIWLLISIMALITLLFVDLRSFFGNKGFLIILYYLLIFGLFAMLLFAPTIKGNRAWIVLGPIQFQPSEIAKVILILVLAHFFSKRHVDIAFWGTIIKSFLYVILPILLVAMQPDLGSAVVLFSIWASFIIFSGIPIKKIIISAIVLVVLFGAMWASVLKPYQKDRIIGVFDSEYDPLGVNYSAIQAKIAIGSGGIFGKGIHQGTQVQLGFLPEAQTDFIFSAIAEEGGFFGVIVLLSAFLLMILRILKIGISSEKNFLKFVCLGTASMFLVQFILNVGSNLSMLPIIGVTFPFVSYGGSSILTNMVLIGIIQSLYVRK